jgi:hypothetical protein
VASPLRPTTRILIFQLNTCDYSRYITSSLRRRCVCRLQLLLVLASAVILGSESSGNHDQIYYLRFETPPTWRARSPYLYRPGTGWPSYNRRHWVPFRRLLRLAGLRWMFHTGTYIYIVSRRMHRKHLLPSNGNVRISYKPLLAIHFLVLRVCIAGVA